VQAECTAPIIIGLRVYMLQVLGELVVEIYIGQGVGPHSTKFQINREPRSNRLNETAQPP